MYLEGGKKKLVYRPTARVLAVLELLQSHGRMTGGELARRLEVNIRTVRDYIEMLLDLGIPVEASSPMTCATSTQSSTRRFR